MSATDVTVHFHAGYNVPGYLPDSDPATFATFEDAKSDILWTLNNHADNVDSWTDEHDCDDVPCPTYGEDCGHDKASSLSLAAEDLNLANGPEWSDVVAGQSYWIVQCAESDCTPDDDDVQCGACPASSCVHHDCPNCGRWTEFDPCPYCPSQAGLVQVHGQACACQLCERADFPPLHKALPEAPKMTRAHFNFLAGLISELWPDDETTNTEYVAECFASALAATNRSFDRDRFVAAATR